MYRKIISNSFGCILLVTVLSVKASGGTPAEPADLIGRWDITIDLDGKPAPSWLEVKLSGNRTLVGFYVGVVGSARSVAEIHFDNDRFHFREPPIWEDVDKNHVIEGQLEA